MNSLAVRVGLLLLALQCAEAETFTAREVVITEETQTAVFRGVINTVKVPVADEMDLGTTQSGYFLFTADVYTITVDEDGERNTVREQRMFQLTPSAEQAKKLDAMLGKPIQLEARIIPAHTRYHRTPILLHIVSFKRLPS